MIDPWGYYGKYPGGGLQRLLLFLLVIPTIFWFVGAL
ncbi:hypothetical protein C8P63_12157 [Melghirimyces profundicolus]|uniref:Uncharacterized protein n=1 Tax=Melghirimyces profundicolus TaxID=1242148 RepID=A0A2T6BGJ2_9BACL|nr:hypothetical protein C8P63_12157 [Melghirimyces profundicolus]